ncbi:doublecortin domain-containing protein 2 isoform X6 [Oncorhynchus kisutch]|uniref:doublecortin domain-containing protein 2 isoform X6 n=1 Tax=Oncorhynchus kisutch TaxID=8019 RepID=UPI0012DC9A4C|nr:doublecortin domain-containing protein 2-like isoform X6 [Oncorhynchus kisutch]
MNSEKPSFLSQPVVKNIFVYRNGDPFYEARRLVVNQKRVSNFDTFLRDVTGGVQAPFGAVRNIYTPRMGHRVACLDHLQSGEQYVAAGREKFKKLDYSQIGSRKKRMLLTSSGQPYPQAKPVPQSRIIVSARFLKPIKEPCSIFVVANGDVLTPALRLLIPQRILGQYDRVLEMITDKMGLRILGCVRSLYTFDGNHVNEGKDLETGQFYVAVGRDKFKRLPYSDLLFTKPRGIRRTTGSKASSLPPIYTSGKQNRNSLTVNHSKSMWRCREPADAKISAHDTDRTSSIVRQISQQRLMILRKRRSGLSISLGTQDNDGAVQTDEGPLEDADLSPQSDLSSEEVRHTPLQSDLTSEEVRHTSPQNDLTSEEVRHTSPQSDLSSEEVKHTPPQSDLTSEEVKHTSPQSDLTSEEKPTEDSKSTDTEESPEGEKVEEEETAVAENSTVEQGDNKEDVTKTTEEQGDNKEDITKRITTEEQGDNKEDITKRITTEEQGDDKEDVTKTTEEQGDNKEDVTKTTEEHGDNKEDVTKTTEEQGDNNEDITKRITTEEQGDNKEDVTKTTEEQGDNNEDITKRITTEEQGDNKEDVTKRITTEEQGDNKEDVTKRITTEEQGDNKEDITKRITTEEQGDNKEDITKRITTEEQGDNKEDITKRITTEEQGDNKEDITITTEEDSDSVVGEKSLETKLQGSLENLVLKK